MNFKYKINKRPYEDENGREGFFDKFKIIFDQANERVALNWNNKTSLKY